MGCGGPTSAVDPIDVKLCRAYLVARACSFRAGANKASEANIQFSRSYGTTSHPFGVQRKSTLDNGRGDSSMILSTVLRRARMQAGESSLTYRTVSPAGTATINTPSCASAIGAQESMNSSRLG